MEYTTQMDAAKRGIITKQMQEVAKEENVAVEVIRQGVAAGKIVIPANKNHKTLKGRGVGAGLNREVASE